MTVGLRCGHHCTRTVHRRAPLVGDMHTARTPRLLQLLPLQLLMILLLLLTECTPCAHASAKEAPVVEINGGLVSGRILTSDHGRAYFAYSGIPYAKPPTGKLRFQFPRRVSEKSWEGVRRCVENAPPCPQLSYPEGHYVGQEDCLYLNVYTHRVQDVSVPMEELVSALRPVLVYLHGGGFQYGSADYDAVGPERFMDNNDDIVLVTLNYRLGALGFLSVGQDTAVGNMGLKDQFMALNWVQGNIAQFGGNPNKVTLAGQQAGGVSAHLHTLSPLSSAEPDMFRQALSMSGTALSPWAVLPAAEARRRALQLGRLLGCIRSSKKDDDVDLRDLVGCLRTRPAEDIVRKSRRVLEWSTDLVFPFVPVVESFDGKNRPFMVSPPRQTLEQGLPGVRAKTWLAGVTTHEGLPMALEMLVFKGSLNDLNSNFEDRVWDYLGLPHVPKSSARTNAARRIKDFYLPGNTTISQATLNSLIDLTSDALYLHGLHESVRCHTAAGKSSTLVYRFGFDRLHGRRDVFGVPQGTDAELIFPAVFADNKTILEDNEQIVAGKIMRLFTNYILTENPTPREDEALDNVLWPPAKDGDFSFLDITAPGQLQVINKGFYKERMALWDSIYKELHPNKDQSSQGDTQQINDEL